MPRCGTIRAMSIHVLSDQLASQIAAGEVVERPFSVVKELVENSIDAGAQTINIDIQEGGRSRIQIADDGTGISAEEIETAFLRHATSKLNSVEDLNAIRTLGFRGEALAAISAVSKVTIVSRAESETAGTRLELEGGKIISRDSVGAPQGTVIAVENLFYNTPARLKFLKSVTTEKRLIDEFTSRYAMAYSHIRFRLTHNGRVTFQSSGNGELRDVMVAVFGPETARELLEIGDLRSETENEANPQPPAPSPKSQINVSGFVGPPSLHWANRSHIVLFMNGRYIKDNSLTYAIIQAYHTLLPTGRYPLGIIFITMPAEEVDVNVHPTKIEVRFRNSNKVFGAVQKAVRSTLIEESPVRSMGTWAVPRQTPAAPGWSGELDENAFVRRHNDPQPEFGFNWAPPAVRPDAGETATSASSAQSVYQPIPATQPPTADLGGGKLPIMRVVGQIGAAYIITEGPDGVFLIDQHAAHERILYEQFMADWKDEDGVTSQGLVSGTAVHLSPPQATLLTENIDVLNQLGFQIEPFGPNAFMVRAVPAILAKMDPAKAVVSVIEDLERGDKPMQGKIEDKIVMRVCKTAAVKAGQTLSQAEMEAMIWQLEACQNPHTCPHGRPTLIYLSVAQLAKQFGRI
jgi:DNA mismatch repair protein MutL